MFQLVKLIQRSMLWGARPVFFKKWKIPCRSMSILQCRFTRKLWISTCGWFPATFMHSRHQHWRNIDKERTCYSGIPLSRDAKPKRFPRAWIIQPRTFLWRRPISGIFDQNSYKYDNSHQKSWWKNDQIRLEKCQSLSFLFGKSKLCWKTTCWDWVFHICRTDYPQVKDYFKWTDRSGAYFATISTNSARYQISIYGTIK